MTGLMSINGSPETGPLRMGTPIVDLATGMYSVIGILMALHERQRSGLGQYLDMTLHDCGMALLHPQAANFFLNGRRPMPPGNAHPNISPYDVFATATGSMFIAIGNDGQFRRMAELIGHPELASDPRFTTNGDRLKHRPALTALLSQAFASQDRIELSNRMLEAGLPAGPVLAVDEAMAAEHTKARGMVTELDGYRGLGTPIKLSRTPGGTRSKPPKFAEHTDAVLARHGYDATEIEALKQAGVLATSRKKSR
jgi:formyl-CoA transferase